MSETTNRYIDPSTDFGFNHLFGNELNKGILLKFLNAVFEGKKQIREVSFLPLDDKIQHPEKASISNLLCETKDGKQFTVQLRNVEERFFRQSSREFIGQFIRELESSDKSSEQTVKQHYMIGLLNFSFGDCEEMYYREISFTKVNKKRQPAGKMGFKFLEIPEFHKPGKELETELDKWFYLLKHLHRWNKIPKWIQDEHFQEVFSAAEVSGLSAEQRSSYYAELKKKKSRYKMYDPEHAAADAVKRVLDEGNLDTDSKEEFLQVFRMGYEAGFEEGLMEITHEFQRIFNIE